MKHQAFTLAGLLCAIAACQGPAARDEERGASPTASSEGPEIVAAPGAGDVAALVKDEIARAPGREVLVYVSASWCEPCVHLEHAVESGALRDEFPALRLFKFDYDRDEARLTQAGYTLELLPLLIVPDADGRPTERRMEGSIKGPEAVATNLVPRLHALLGH